MTLRAAREIGAGGRTAEIATALAQQFGDFTALTKLERVLDDPSVQPVRRCQAIATLASKKAPALENMIVQLLDDPAVRREAIRAAAAFDNPAFPPALLDRYASFSADERMEAVYALAARSSYSLR